MSSRILITAPSSLGRWAHAGSSSSWVYLGTDLSRRASAERALGAERRLEIGPRLTQAMSALRQPFLDLIASIGAEQTDPLGWWSSRFSWKMWTTSDLFLLICCLCVARDLACETRKSGGSLVIVVEDRWLLRQIQEILAAGPELAGSPGAPQVRGRIGLAGEKTRLVFLGAARRARWLWTTLRNHWRQRALWPREGWAAPERPAAAICSYPLRSSMTGRNGWEDHHLPGLDRLLSEEGWRVMRFTPPDCPGFEKDLAARASSFRPLVLFATPRRVWRSLLALWRPRWPADPKVGELSVGWLLRREWWLDVGRSSFCGFRLFYETLDALLSRGSWGPVIFSYENQPWEKLTVLAARRHGASTCGIQTAILSPDYLPYALGKEEETRIPLPDSVLTSGPYARRVLAEGGMPSERLQICGAIRYQALVKAATNLKSVPGTISGTVPGTALRSRVLVVLPIHPPVCEDLLEAIRRAFPDGGKADGLELTVRPHPLYAAGAARLRFPARVLPSSFRDIGEALADCGLVLFAGSTVGFEAMAQGVPALRYRPETTLDVDLDVYGDAVPLCGERDLREALLGLIRRGPPLGWEERTRERVLQLFAPFNARGVREAFGRGKITNLSGFLPDDQLEPDAAGQRQGP